MLLLESMGTVVPDVMTACCRSLLGRIAPKAHEHGLGELPTYSDAFFQDVLSSWGVM